METREQLHGETSYSRMRQDLAWNLAARVWESGKKKEHEPNSEMLLNTAPWILTLNGMHWIFFGFIVSTCTSLQVVLWQLKSIGMKTILVWAPAVEPAHILMDHNHVHIEWRWWEWRCIDKELEIVLFRKIAVIDLWCIWSHNTIIWNFTAAFASRSREVIFLIKICLFRLHNLYFFVQNTNRQYKM